ncbi:MAG: hypothetical protein J6S99_03645 [Bacteroidales bacterium]|nr:hypothetical protein [Bacteroidales bacterium]
MTVLFVFYYSNSYAQARNHAKLAHLRQLCKCALPYRKNRTCRPDLPSPGLPSPDLPSPDLPSPGLPSPGLPSPGLPSPGLPSPGLPSPAGGQKLFFAQQREKPISAPPSTTPPHGKRPAIWLFKIICGAHRPPVPLQGISGPQVHASGRHLRTPSATGASPGHIASPAVFD